MSRKAAGKHAFGFCDRTGFRYPLKDLVPEYIQGKPTGFRIGRDVADPDHPQNWIGKTTSSLSDPQALHDPRPDLSLGESRRMFSWNPVGVGNMGMFSAIGDVTIT